METIPSFNPGAPAAAPAREIVLADYLRPLWRHRWLLAAAALAGGLAALAIALTSTPAYEASTKLLVGRSKIGEDTAESQPVSIATFRALLENQGLAAQVLREQGLDKPPFHLTVSEFLGKHLRVDTIRDSYVLVITVSLPDRQLASRAADRLAALALQLAEKLSQDETVKGRDIIKVQLDESRKSLELATTRLESFKKQAQVELMREDAGDLLDQRRLLGSLLVQIEGERSKLARAERELAGQERTRGMATPLDTSAVLRDAQDERARREQDAREQDARALNRLGASEQDGRALNRPDGQQGSVLQPGRPEQPGQRGRGERSLRDTPVAAASASLEDAPKTPTLRPGLVDPFINPVYEVLNQEVALGRSRLSGLERQRDDLLNRLHLGGRQLAIFDQLYARETELTKLQTEMDLARNIYVEMATRYEQARLRVAGRSAGFQILDAAYPPDRPVAPRPLRNTAAGLVVGLVAGVALVALRQQLS